MNPKYVPHPNHTLRDVQYAHHQLNALTTLGENQAPNIKVLLCAMPHQQENGENQYGSYCYYIETPQ